MLLPLPEKRLFMGQNNMWQDIIKTYFGEIPNNNLNWITQFQIIGYPGACVFKEMIYQFICRGKSVV